MLATISLDTGQSVDPAPKGCGGIPGWQANTILAAVVWVSVGESELHGTALTVDCPTAAVQWRAPVV